MTRHQIRTQYTDIGQHTHATVTLPDIPVPLGVVVTTDRSDTEPRQPIIRHDAPTRRPHGIALQAAALRRVEWVRAALAEVREAGE